MLATDNHVGYLEKDPIRGQDSLNTFREILQLAQQHDVDFILLGGDLFHENKPSRATLHGVMASLREYTLGDKPVSIELLSDPFDGKADGYSFPAVNYEDSNLNVAIPVFSIHGNHDDPQGVGVEGALSALDVLSVAGLINYFGKVELPSTDGTAGRSAAQANDPLMEDGIRIRPVLLQKGGTRIALYGMGNVKDDRMGYELRANRVRMYRPAEEPLSWFNILAVHQNRVGHDPKAFVPEGMFDNSVHLVVWGHEHEQLITPQPVAEKRYCVTQPGSSVATSLMPGEAAEKKVAIIHVEERDYYLEEIPLRTVRPFVMEDIDLDDEIQDANIAADDKPAVTKLLKQHVYGLIQRAHEEWTAKQQRLEDPSHPAERMPLPLVRLRVTYTKHEMGNLVRFGQEFVDKLANPKDVLQFTKKKASGARKKRDENVTEYIDPQAEGMVASEKLEKVHVGDLVREYLEAQELNILNPVGLERAVTSFIEKDNKDAIKSFVANMLKSSNKDLVSMNPDEQQLDVEVSPELRIA
ncbi:DNA repair exonuclease [Ceraceosorus guamensis]|uniref:DNA repair exonuclease n=1 Tax=Ceraceosorus guamensis TaxID=1522189 RepID=A0A316W5D9_9BASI|nr:DNA repair exonuclease [Ceraceosorus guamensis]PWN45160.1 DNA repair exonuclease [Ceraceosorus guamensis]